MSQQILAVDCEGVALSKDGQMTLMQISLPDKRVFVFDILSGGKGMFDGLNGENKRGLRAILEHRGIVKLLHDCRSDWDSLIHQFNVRIFNFMDTQEAYFVYKLVYEGEVTLPLSLTRFIQFFSKNSLKHKDTMKDKMKNNPKMWAERPLSNEMLEYACEDVVFLIDSWNNINQFFNKNLKELVSVASILKVVERNLFDEFKDYLISQILYIKAAASAMMSINSCQAGVDCLLNTDFTLIFLKFKAEHKKKEEGAEEESKQSGGSTLNGVIQSGLRYKTMEFAKKAERKDESKLSSQGFNSFKKRNCYNKFNGRSSPDGSSDEESSLREETKCRDRGTNYYKAKNKQQYGYNNYGGSSGYGYYGNNYGQGYQNKQYYCNY